MTKAQQQGNGLMEELLNEGLGIAAARLEALKRIRIIESGIPLVKGAVVSMNPTIIHLDSIREVINDYQIPEADEV